MLNFRVFVITRQLSAPEINLGIGPTSHVPEVSINVYFFLTRMRDTLIQQ